MQSACQYRWQKAFGQSLHLADLVQEESQAGRGMEGVLGWYVERLENAKIEESERFWLRAIEEQDKVRILTIHAAKGLEFPIVFAPLSGGERLFRQTGQKHCVFYIPKMVLILTSMETI